jgi:hypothetical protein
LFRAASMIRVTTSPGGAIAHTPRPSPMHVGSRMRRADEVQTHALARGGEDIDGERAGARAERKHGRGDSQAGAVDARACPRCVVKNALPRRDRGPHYHKGRSARLRDPGSFWGNSMIATRRLGINQPVG